MVCGKSSTNPTLIATFVIDRSSLALVLMRLRSLFFDSALAWCVTSCTITYAAESATVDPFLKAAQMAEEISVAKGVEEPDLAGNFEPNGEPVACGDEVGM